MSTNRHPKKWRRCRGAANTPERREGGRKEEGRKEGRNLPRSCLQKVLVPCGPSTNPRGGTPLCRLRAAAPPRRSFGAPREVARRLQAVRLGEVLRRRREVPELHEAPGPAQVRLDVPGVQRHRPRAVVGGGSEISQHEVACAAVVVARRDHDRVRVRFGLERGRDRRGGSRT